MARPPVATGRLSRLADGRLLYRLKRRWHDGTTHVVFEPQELLERLAALVPPPRSHQVRYHGILAPCASYRRQAVAGLPDITGHVSTWDAPQTNARIGKTTITPPPDVAEATRASSKPAEGKADATSTRETLRRFSWAALMQRVFAIDVLECPRCSGRMRILATIHDPLAAAAILACLDLPTRAPPNLPATPDDPDDLERFP